MKIYEKIQKYSESKGETTISIGKEFGLTQQAISNYFTGKNAMPLNFLVWYVRKHPELDLYALFDKEQQNIVSDDKSEYRLVVKKREVINKIVKILEEEI